MHLTTSQYLCTVYIHRLFVLRVKWFCYQENTPVLTTIFRLPPLFSIFNSFILILNVTGRNFSDISFEAGKWGCAQATGTSGCTPPTCLYLFMTFVSICYWILQILSNLFTTLHTLLATKPFYLFIS